MSSSPPPSKRQALSPAPPAAEEEEEWVGPLPSEAATEREKAVLEKKKRKKILPYESVYLSHLPTSQYYEKSFMHRDVVSHVHMTPNSQFLITASVDGHVKFWKKQEVGIEFVKHYRAHLGNVQDASVNVAGSLYVSISSDKSLKVFDVINFDMINMMKFEYVPLRCEWIHRPGDAIATVAVSHSETGAIYVYNGHGDETPLHSLERLHTGPVLAIRFNAVFETVISIDKSGIIEYWSNQGPEFEFPESKVEFESKLESDLFELVRQKTTPRSLAISPDGKLFAIMCTDRKLRVFRFLAGKLSRVFDESLQYYSDLQQKESVLSNMEFGRRMAVERDLEKAPTTVSLGNLLFDETGNFLLYSSMLGVKVVNLVTNKCVRWIGRAENIRLLGIALFQGTINKPTAALTVEMEASDNPALKSSTSTDPTLICTAFKKNRFYLFTQRDSHDTDRDVFNEKPSKEDIISATSSTIQQKLYENAIIYTSLGDIHLKLFAKECPKTIENFCVHSKNGYYNGHIFHRIIKGFMIQTGDPTGTGTGGESIWGGEFEDEFVSSLRHDRPYTVSMANAGPNTNGSQFFITVIPTPWLDNKHTVFGRVVKGMEVVQNISQVKTHPKTEKPYEDVTIVNVALK
ncbi:unnamed protein product [Cyprideis torosa]|uniref:peptidylprolyl isomerase n=1 Tax=Cyprideis torosa TaxID=163714 RepID=A0A7R8WAP4_9CRUS|nr:unnamed protein product [Cyprideis torosa]CAG0891267.1 unnamed protein product [Cyprideis torosa]